MIFKYEYFYKKNKIYVYLEKIVIYGEKKFDEIIVCFFCFTFVVLVNYIICIVNVEFKGIIVEDLLS